MTTRRPLPGFLSSAESIGAAPTGVPADAVRTRHGAVGLWHWGLDSLAADPVLSLSRVRRRSESGHVSDGDIVTAMRRDPRELTGLLPPFAAARGDEGGVSMVADGVGFRQLYYGADARVMSTSAVVAGHASGARLDHHAVAVQSLLGWQLGQRTLFDGIAKLPPGATARQDHNAVTILPATATGASATELPLNEAVTRSAAILRRSLERLLDDHPDVVLQLSGGQDSRLLLSALPPARRRGLRAMTLGSPGDGDVRVARRIAELCGLDHEVRGLAEIAGVTPADAWERVVEASVRLDGQSDPVALAALGLAEAQFDQGARISGVGGEVARGFYYLGRVHDRAFGPDDAQRMAGWRMFANDAVEPRMLTQDFATWGRDVANREVYDALRAGGDEWFRATDALFLHSRVQRWAGANDTAVHDRRIVVNPMLGEEFLDVVSRLAPEDKAHSRFFALLQCELDPELARLPLEGRPAPAAYARQGVRNAVGRFNTTARKLVAKAGQRLRRGNRAPGGADTLSALVAEHWRNHPEILADARVLDEFVRPEWMTGVLSGEVSPRPSSVAFATNLMVVGRTV